MKKLKKLPALFRKATGAAILFAAATTAGVLTSCNNDTDQHQLAVMYPGVSLLYADNTTDSLVFLTFDSWSMHSNASWLTPRGKTSATVNHDASKRYQFIVYFDVEANTTGKSRWGNVEVFSYEYSASAYYLQLGCHNVMHPAGTPVTYINDNRNLPETIRFEATDSANVTLDSLCFSVQADWTLSFAEGEDATWLTPEKTAGTPGENIVRVSMTENTSDKERQTTLTLKSSGVSTDISFKQLPKKEED